MDAVSTSPATGPTTYTVYRNVAHPWSGEPGWDIMLIQSDRDGFAKTCEKRGWQVWCLGESECGSPRAVLMKPHGLAVGNGASSWADPSPWPEIVV